MSQVSTTVSPELAYRKMGSGPVMILLHGFPEDGSLWRNIWDELGSEFNLIIPDLPGSGGSVLEGTADMPQMAASIKAVMDQEGVSKAVIAGHSMGGYVALAFARLYPHMVAGLTLVHSSPFTDDEEKIKTRRKSIELIEKGGKELFVKQMIPNLFAEGFKQANPQIIKEQIDHALEMDGRSMVNFYNAMIARADNSELLAMASFPVQWLLGTEDNLISYKKMTKECYRSAINFVSFYEGSGHMSMIECPRELETDLKRFGKYCYERYVTV